MLIFMPELNKKLFKNKKNIPTNHSLIKNGFTEVGNLFNTGESLARNEVQLKINRQIPFTTYQGIMAAIPKT